MLSERAQKRTLYHLFTDPESRHYDTRGFGLNEDPNPLDFTEPWRSLFVAAQHHAKTPIVGSTPLYQATEEVADDADEARRMRLEIELACAPVYYPTLAELAATIEPVQWLWQNWIPRGMLSVLGAYQGAGKSYFVMDLARACIDGDQWPDGSDITRGGPVIYVDAESIPQVNNERAQRLHLDTDQLYLVMPKDGEFIDLNTITWRERLWNMIEDIKPALVIIDSLSTISLKGQNSVEETTQLLMYLVQLARHGNCGMLVLHHLRKPQSGQLPLPGINIHDFRGSSHITAMARTVLGLSVIQSPKTQFSLNGQRIIQIAKTNLGPYPLPIGLELIEEDDTARFEYEEDPDISYERTRRDTCETWLLEFLEENGPTRPVDVVEAAEEEGYSRRTVYRARKALGDSIRNTEGKQSPRNCWALQEEEDESEEENDL